MLFPEDMVGCSLRKRAARPCRFCPWSSRSEAADRHLVVASQHRPAQGRHASLDKSGNMAYHIIDG
jgi:hypothetical protein